MKDNWVKEFYEFGNKVYFDWDGKPEVLVDYVRSLLTSQKKQIVEMIKNELDVVAPLPNPPFREDYIKKWDIIKKLEEA